LFLTLLGGFVLFRPEKKISQVSKIRSFLSFTLIAILFTSAAVTPLSMASSYWSGVSADEINATEAVTESVTPESTATEPATEEQPVDSSNPDASSSPPSDELTSDAISATTTPADNSTTTLSAGNSTSPSAEVPTTSADNSTTTVPASDSTITTTLAGNSTSSEVAPPLPDATLSLQFDQPVAGTTSVAGDAAVEEKLDVTSLNLDGVGDFVQVTDTGSRELTTMSLSAWVKPDYSDGSSEFTVVSKDKAFVLAINNNIPPYKIAKFSVFDGIKWTTIESTTQIGEEWTHLAATFDGSSIGIYVNGNLESTLPITGIPSLTVNGQLELTPVDSISSDSDIVIGAYLSEKSGHSETSNQFSGSVGDVHLYDSLLEPAQISEIYNQNIISYYSSEEIENSALEHDAIEIGKPVTWTQSVVMSEPTESVAVEVPADAQIIQVETSTGESIDLSTIEATTQSAVLDNEVPVASLVPEMVQEEKPTELVLINGVATDYTVTFETPAPYTTEEDQSTPELYSKEVIVAHDSTLHYTDVKSYSDIPEDLVAQGVPFKLYWIIDGQRTDVTEDPRFTVEYVDTNGNGIVDQMQWIVPQLSEQQFVIEAQLTIINVQSYPTVGGNWTVKFTTVGTGNLIITAVNGTTFGDSLPSDLKFLELKTGKSLIDDLKLEQHNDLRILTPIIQGNSIIFYNYSSAEQGFAISEVLTSGKHHLEFRFGNDVEYAHNFAIGPIPPISIGTFDQWSSGLDKTVAVSTNDNTASVIFSTANNQIQTFVMGNALVPSDVIITGVTLNVVAREATNQNARIQLTITNAGNINQGQGIDLNPFFTQHSRTFTTNPFTGRAWTLDEVSDWSTNGHRIEFGVSSANDNESLVTYIFVTINFSRCNTPDHFGYTCISSNQVGGPTFSWIDIRSTGTIILPNSDDVVQTGIPIGFSFNFYGAQYNQISVSNNGLLFVGPVTGQYTNEPIGSSSPNGFMAPFWDDLVTYRSTTDAVYYKTIGVAPNRIFVVEWFETQHYSSSPTGITFEAILYEGSNNIQFQYLDVDFGTSFYNNGASATVGIESTDGRGSQYSFDEPVLSPNLAILFTSHGVTPPIDTTPPDTTITSSPLNPSNSASASFSFTSTEPGTFECFLDTPIFATCTSPQSYSALSDGLHTFRVRAIDTAGNVDLSPASFTWTIDTAPPTTTIVEVTDGNDEIMVDGGTTNSNEINIAFIVSDGIGSGVVSSECTLDDGEPEACTNPKSYSELNDGSHTVEIRSTDAAGNLESTAIFSWTVDTTPPSISAPAGITAEATGPSGAVVSYTVTATDLVDGIVTPVCTPDSGSTFPLGTTTVTCDATDTIGNIASVSFDVNVEDTTAPVIIAPAGITAEATDPSGAIVSYVVTATDAVGVTSGPTCSTPSGSTFPLGTTTVICIASDAATNTGSASFIVSVVSTTGPSITTPSSIVTEATGPTGAVVTYAVTASSPVGIASGPTCLPASGSTFPIGTTTVTCTATDNAAITVSTPFDVIVQDTTTPLITAPSDITAEATGPSGAVVSYTVTATDLVDGIVTPICTPASGSTFSLGTTTVTCDATDSSGNIDSVSFIVSVVSTTGPTITVPAPITAEATGPTGAVVTYAVTASSPVGILTGPTCTPASGSTFPIGTTTVTCTATDNAENTAFASFTVTVRDTTAPVITAPAPITTTTTTSGAVVSYTVTATDAVGVTSGPTCSTPSGSTFPIGTTTVICIASDAAGNTGSASFTVTVDKLGPSIVSLSASDPDGITTGEDGGFTNGDTITVIFNEPTNRPTVATTTDLNNLFTFSQSIGTSYTGSWSSKSVLVITILDKAGGSPTIGGLTLTVKASANLKNEAGTSLPSTAVSPFLTGDFGQKAGPSITSITAADPGTVVENISNGDTITVRFSEATNTPSVATTAQLNALFTFSQSIGASYSGIWQNSRTLVITTDDSTGGTATVGVLTLTVKASGNLRDAASTSLQSTSISPILAGTFGQKAGPFITSLIAKDPFGLTGGFGNGDAITVKFSEPTNEPAVATTTDLNNLFTFSQSIGTSYTGTWFDPLTLVITVDNAAGGTATVGVLTLTVKESGNLKNAASTSLASTALSPVLSGTFETKPGPSIVSIKANDPDGVVPPELGGLTNGDTITVTFSEATSRPFFDPVTVISKTNLDNLFTFSQSIGTSYTGKWKNPLTLEITVGDSTGGTATVGVLTLTVNAGANLKNAENTSLVSTSLSPTLTGSFGEKEGPSIKSLVADDPDNSDSIFSNGDTLNIRFNEPTNTPDPAPAGLSKTDLDALFTFSQEIGDSYSGSWIDSSTLVITILDSTTDSPPEVGALRLTVKASANLKDAASSSFPSTAVSPFLSGSFGTFVEVISVGDGGTAYTTLPSGISTSITLPGGNSGVMTFERATGFTPPDSILIGVLGDVVEISPSGGADCSSAPEGCEISFEFTTNDAVSNGLTPPTVKVLHDADDDGVFDTSPSSDEILDGDPAGEEDTTVTGIDDEDFAAFPAFGHDLWRAIAVAHSNSKFAIGGVKALLGASLFGGGSNNVPPSVVTVTFGGNDQSSSTDTTVIGFGGRLAGSNLNPGMFKTGEPVKMSSAKIVKTGDPLTLKLAIQEEEGALTIEHVAFYINLLGNEPQVDNSDTYVIYEKLKPTVVVDPHGFFSEVNVATSQIDAMTLALTYDIKFAKPMAKSDIIIRSWDIKKNVDDTKLLDALEVVEPNTLPRTIPDWVKNNANWWSSGQIADSDFVQGVQYLIKQGIVTIPETEASSDSSQQIPTWIKNNAGWWAEGLISDDDFISAMQWLITNGIMKV